MGVAYKAIFSNLVQPAILGYILPSNPPLSFRALLSVPIEAIAGFKWELSKEMILESGRHR
jgi:hypothetical protein